MPKPHLVIDIETAPREDVSKCITDYFESRRWKKKHGETDEDLQERIISDKCILPLLAKTVCVVLRSGGFIEVITDQDSNEEKLLNDFWTLIHNTKVTYKNLRFVTFNGLSFDFPFLEARSTMLNVEHFDLPKRRFTFKEHFDVRMSLTNWNSYFPGSLYVWASVAGIETDEKWKTEKIHELYANNDMPRIIEHCKECTRVIELLYLRKIKLLN
jgi:predicted PolB exonuclease-like 3'-5' exonuclease